MRRSGAEVSRRRRWRKGGGESGGGGEEGVEDWVESLNWVEGRIWNWVEVERVGVDKEREGMV
jgi:hypothetical protein